MSRVQFVEFKPPPEGARLAPKNFRPHIALIVQAVAEEAPSLEKNTLVVTEAWRIGTGLHPEANAFDFRTWNILAASEAAREQHRQAWKARVQERLGEDYDVVVHGEGTRRHLHVEFDDKGV